MALSSKISDAILGGRSQAFLSDEIFDVVFDTTFNTSESDSAQVSRHAVEDGGDVSDNIVKTPKKFSLSAVLTDDDWDLLDPSGFFDSTIQDRLETLEGWIDDRELLTYYGHENDIEDVVLTNVTRNHTLDTGNGVGIDITIEKVNIATFLVAAISLSSATAKGATSKGSAKKAGSATASKNKSILSKLF